MFRWYSIVVVRFWRWTWYFTAHAELLDEMCRCVQMEKSFLALWWANRSAELSRNSSVLQSTAPSPLYRSLEVNTLVNGALRVEMTSGKRSILWTSSNGASYCKSAQRRGMHSDPSPKSVARIPPRSTSIGIGKLTVLRGLRTETAL